MARESHDHNFKNLVMDFPKETLQWLMPEAMDDFGPIRDIRFVREEPKKRKLSDSNLVLDMPVLFVFKNRKLLLWLVEFQEDKSKFSIYKLLRYTTDYMEEYPDAIVIPMRERIYKKITEHKETAMLAQYIREKGFQEGVQVGVQQGIRKGIQQGIRKGSANIISKLMENKFNLNSNDASFILTGLKPEDMVELADEIMKSDSYDDIKIWILKKTGKKTTS